MKARIATAVSIAGVLTAGSAAALVNSQVLDDSANRASSSLTAGRASASSAKSALSGRSPARSCATRLSGCSSRLRRTR